MHLYGSSLLAVAFYVEKVSLPKYVLFLRLLYSD